MRLSYSPWIAGSSPTEEFEVPPTPKLWEEETATKDTPVDTVELSMCHNCTHTVTWYTSLVVGNIEFLFSIPTLNVWFPLQGISLVLYLLAAWLFVLIDKALCMRHSLSKQHDVLVWTECPTLPHEFFSDFWTWAQDWEKVITSMGCIDLWSQADGYGSSTPCWPHSWALLLVTCSTEKWWEPGIVSHVSMM